MLTLNVDSHWLLTVTLTLTGYKGGADDILESLKKTSRNPSVRLEGGHRSRI